MSIPLSPFPAPAIRVIAVDEQPLLTYGIECLFRETPDIVLVAKAHTAEQALQHISGMQADVVILDMRIGLCSGLEVIRDMARLSPSSSPVILTSAISNSEFFQATELGVRGLLLKSMPQSLITRCVRMVHQGEEFIEKSMLRQAFGHLMKQKEAETQIAKLLTAKELAVVQLTVNGLSNKHVARELQISEGTVKIHLHRSYEKLSVHGRYQLMRLAHEIGLS